ncbi:MAG: ABC transporter ATP-binding protein [Clostridiales bacterium]|nr:ABC transporter ATP-binding protein [Clostridiales bacterium]
MAKREESYYGRQLNTNVFRRLMTYARPYWLWILAAILLVLFLTTLELYKPVLEGYVIDEIVTNRSFSKIKGIALRYIFVLTGFYLSNILQTMILQYMGQNIIYNIRQELYQHVHSLSLRFFDITPVGKLVTRITNDVEALNEMYSTIIIKLFRNLVKIIGLVIVMFYHNVRLAVYSITLLPLIIVLTIIFRKISRATYRIARTKLTTVNTFLSEHISGMKFIQIFAKEKEKYQEFETKSKDLYKANFREIMVFAIFRPIIYFLSVVALAIVLDLGSYLVIEGGITIGILYIFVNYVNSFFQPIQEMAEQLGVLQSAMASAEKIFSIMDEEPLITNKPNPVRRTKFEGKIEFENVWFAYEDDNWILKDVSFTIEPGMSAAFVGATGAGKSSILNLIGRYYDIQKGSIKIDDIDIRDLHTDDLRRAIGQVQQDVFIFTGDIKTNIRLFNKSITDKEIEEAASYVNANSFIDKLPGKYDEPVMERGATLSSGERQLLSFARTLAYNPSILVLDEATANIDTETEKLIQDALGKLMQGRTTIMVAHRLSTIQHADKIFVMHKGKIIESGTHQDLLKLDGMYKKLYDLQVQ